MKELKDMTFGFVGLGLMGGSIAKGIKDKVFKAKMDLKMILMEKSMPWIKILIP